MRELAVFAIFAALSTSAAMAGHVPVTETATETVVYSFCSQQLCTDGAYP